MILGACNRDETPTATPHSAFLRFTFTPTPNEVQKLEAKSTPPVVPIEVITLISDANKIVSPQSVISQTEAETTAKEVALETQVETPTPVVSYLIALQDMNVRSGPGTNYPIIGF